MDGGFRVGEWRVEPRLNTIASGDHAVHVEPKVMGVLVRLANQPGVVLTKEQIMRAVWPDTFVTDDVLTHAIAELRKAFADDTRAPRFIQTIPKGGYRLIAPVARDGSGTASSPGASPVSPSPTPRPQRRSRLSRLVLLGAALAIVATVTWAVRALPTRTERATLRVLPLTSLPGSENTPALSPDGNQVAFAWDGGNPDGPQQLYVKLVDSGTPVRLTQGPGSVSGMAWSPDGRQLAFVRERPGASSAEVLVIPALGGPARVVAGNAVGPWGGLSWAPDGHQLAFVERKSASSPSGIALLSLEDGSVRQLTPAPPDVDGDSDPRFSPDGRSLAFIRRPLTGHTADIHVMSLDNGQIRRLTSDRTNVWGMDWSEDGRDLVFSSTRPGSQGRFSLWRVAALGGTPQRLTVGEDGVRPSISRHGHRLAYARWSFDLDIFQMPGPKSGEPQRTPQPFATSTRLEFGPGYSPDGEEVAFTSDRSGANAVWVCDRDGSGLRQLTFGDSPRAAFGDWSPDGKRLVFFTNLTGPYDLFTVSADGGFPQRLTKAPFDKVLPHWSRDGSSIYYSSRRNGVAEIWKLPLSGGEGVQMTHGGGTEAYESPDGATLYFVKRARGRGPRGTWRVPTGGGAEERVAALGEEHGWAVFDDGACYIGSNAAEPGIQCLDFGSGEVRTMPLERNPIPLGLAVSRDGRSILFVQAARDEHDLVRVEGFQ
jgi:Tol biopolymer transport system component/DNA-binding winged helix-turn-helix (wHTH) protein